MILASWGGHKHSYRIDLDSKNTLYPQDSTKNHLSLLTIIKSYDSS